MSDHSHPPISAGSRLIGLRVVLFNQPLPSNILQLLGDRGYLEPLLIGVHHCLNFMGYKTALLAQARGTGVEPA